MYFSLYKDHIAVNVNKKGKYEIMFSTSDDENKFTMIDMPGETYYTGIRDTDFKDNNLRFFYTSMTTPLQIKEYNFDTGKVVIKKTQTFSKDYNENDYISERIYAKADDGKLVPISLIYKKDKLSKKGDNPLLLYGYGAFGTSMPPVFDFHNSMAFVDRGGIFAVAHIRGGADMGYYWYDDA